MKKDLLWSLFQTTGKIEYYMKFKEEVRKEVEESEQGNSF